MDYGSLAARYDELRPAGRGWLEVADLSLAALAGATRLLDVGCGTGRFAVLAAERLGCRAWGVDASAEMLTAARARPGGERVGWRLARAERLPFRTGWFDAVHAHLVLHAVEDRPGAVREMGRVCAPGGRLAVVSFAREHFQGFYLAPYFPSLEPLDRARFPEPEEIAAEAVDAGFRALEVERLDQPIELEAAVVLERVRGRYISTLHLLSEDEYREGLRRLEREVAAGRAPFRGVLRWALVRGRRAAA